MDKAHQEMHLAIRYKSVLGLGSSMQAHCSARHFNQIMPAYQQASNLIGPQAGAPLSHAIKWQPLQHIMDQVGPGTTSLRLALSCCVPGSQPCSGTHCALPCFQSLHQ